MTGVKLSDPEKHYIFSLNSTNRTHLMSAYIQSETCPAVPPCPHCCTAVPPCCIAPSLSVPSTPRLCGTVSSLTVPRRLSPSLAVPRRPLPSLFISLRTMPNLALTHPLLVVCQRTCAGFRRCVRRRSDFRRRWSRRLARGSSSATRRHTRSA